MTTQYDVVIVGGGLVGATLALALLRSARLAPQRLCVLEKSAPSLWTPAGAPDLRVLALSRSSERILSSVGVWDRVLAARAFAYQRMHIWHAREAARSAAALRFDAADLAQPNLGHIVENALLIHMLQQQLHAQGIALRQASLDGLTYGPTALQLQVGGETLSTRLLVGADGARSTVRKLAGLWMNSEDYGQSGLVANIRSERPHEHTAWQRFLGDGTLALLPLGQHECSIVWSVPTRKAQALQAMPSAEFNRELTQASDSVLGSLSLLGARASFPLRRMSALQYVQERCALIGDAAHVVHPLAGQGANLGLLDAAALADVLGSAEAQREDLGAVRLLRRYERWRKSENELMSRAFDAFNSLLSFGDGAAARLAQRGLGWVGRSEALRRLFMTRALGMAGELPSAAMTASAAGQL